MKYKENPAGIAAEAEDRRVAIRWLSSGQGVERLATGLWNMNNYPGQVPWAHASERERAPYLDQARAIIAALVAEAK